VFSFFNAHVVFRSPFSRVESRSWSTVVAKFSPCETFVESWAHCSLFRAELSICRWWIHSSWLWRTHANFFKKIYVTWVITSTHAQCVSLSLSKWGRERVSEQEQDKHVTSHQADMHHSRLISLVVRGASAFLKSLPKDAVGALDCNLMDCGMFLRHFCSQGGARGSLRVRACVSERTNLEREEPCVSSSCSNMYNYV